jgi:hypothetical protein
MASYASRYVVTVTSVRTPKIKSAFLRYPCNHLPVDMYITRRLRIVITVKTMRNPGLAKTLTTVVDSLGIYTDALKQNCPWVNPLNAELNPICHLLVLLGDLRFMGPCIVSILPYTCISNKMQTLHSLFISGNCSTCFEWYFHPSSGAHSTVSTASVVCHTVTAICRYRGRVGTGLSVLWVAYATHSTLKRLHLVGYVLEYY